MMAEQTELLAKLVSDVADLKIQNLQIQKANIEIEKSITITSELYDYMKNQVKYCRVSVENTRNIRSPWKKP